MNILLSFLKMISRYESAKYNNYFKFLFLDTKNHYYFINPYKERKTIDKKFFALYDIPNITIIDAQDDYFTEKSWKKSYAFIDKILSKYKIDKHLIVYLGVMKNYRRGINDPIKQDYENSLHSDFYKTNFNINFSYLNRALFAYYIQEVKGIESFQMITDPQEPDFIKNRWYFFDCPPPENMRWVPFVEYGFFYNNINPSFKNIDFTFGCTILTKKRTYITSQIIKLKQNLEDLRLSNNIYLKDKFADINTLVNIYKYNTEVGKSRFTMIIPSYDSNHFSNIRFFEALASDTISLIHNEANLERGLQHYPELLKVFRKYVVKLNEVPDKIKSINYEVALKEIKENKDYIKMATDLNFYKEKFKDIFNYEKSNY